MDIAEIFKTYWQAVLVGMGISAFLLGYSIRFLIGKISRKSNERIAIKILNEAKTESEMKRKEALFETKEEIYRTRMEFEKEMQERRNEVVSLEKRILQKEENLEKRAELTDRKEMDLRNRDRLLNEKEEKIEIREKELNEVFEKEREQLQSLSGLSREEAKKILLSKIERDVAHDEAMMIRQAEARIQEDIQRKSQWLLANVLQRCVVDHVQGTTVTLVSLPNDDIKGKIIGREGRNIRAFEVATGVDLIIDDTPETVVISAFDMVRREIARLALEQLIREGRIHPARIEEVVDKVKREMEDEIRQAGERTVFELGLTTVHSEIVKLVGRLKYRTSYGQSVLDHSKEVAWLLGGIAAELGLDVKLAKRIGLLHDIGKAVSHEMEGSHAVVGGDLARKFNESQDVVSGIKDHHADHGEQSLWGVLTQVADAISAARPGARSDTVENYLQRLEKLEEIANSFRGVERSYAIQAGREIRVVVKPEEISDDGALLLSRDIAKRVQNELQYPGTIKVTVIREKRTVEYAR